MAVEIEISVEIIFFLPNFFFISLHEFFNDYLLSSNLKERNTGPIFVFKMSALKD